jgi:DNA-binding beta-propeller fold protein YncE
MNVLSRIRLSAIILFVLLLGGCASTDTIRGQLNYDLRPEAARPEVFWPPAPETPRYRYVGELLGEPNFAKSKEKQAALTTAFNWLVGLFEGNTPVLLQRPQHGAVSDSGRIYVVDAGRNAVLAFDPNPPAEDESENKDGHLLIWNKATKIARFAAPVAVAIAWNGDILVSDAILGVVVRLNNKGEPIGTLGAGQLKRPTGLAFDQARGLLFVADTVANDIKVFDASGNLVKTFGAPGDGKGELNAPTHLALSEQKLYVSDTLNSRVQVFDAEGRYLREIGARGLYVGNLTRPKGVAIGGAGIVYVVESYYNHLLIYNQQGQLLLGINGSGVKGNNFLLPSGVWTDSQGRVYVADMFNSRIVMFQAMASPATKTLVDDAVKQQNTPGAAPRTKQSP